MRLSSNGQRLLKELSKQYDEGIVRTYFYALIEGYPTDYFPISGVERKDITKQDWDQVWFEAWLELWPKQSETGLSYAVSGNKPECKKRMITFLQDWHKRLDGEPDLDRITEATKNYIEAQRGKNWQFTKKNHKFIQDTNGSVLEEWLNKEPEQKHKSFQSLWKQ